MGKRMKYYLEYTYKEAYLDHMCGEIVFDNLDKVIEFANRMGGDYTYRLLEVTRELKLKPVETAIKFEIER